MLENHLQHSFRVLINFLVTLHREKGEECDISKARQQRFIIYFLSGEEQAREAPFGF